MPVAPPWCRDETVFQHYGVRAQAPLAEERGPQLSRHSLASLQVQYNGVFILSDLYRKTAKLKRDVPLLIPYGLSIGPDHLVLHLFLDLS